MRVISGSAKGLLLKGVPGKSTRPITDRVKEALFNILSGEIVDASILDLFGGSGAVGIEALSRGAAHLVTMDTNYKAYRIIKENLESTGLSPYASVYKKDAFNFLKSKANQTFDIIYIAPPQYKGMWLKAMRLLEENPDWIPPGKLVIVQIHPKEYEKINDYTNFSEIAKREYGDTLLVFYERISPE